MGGGKGGDSGGRQQDALDQQIYDQFYDAGAAGADYYWGGAADREVGAQMGYQAGAASRPQEGFDIAGFMHGQQAALAESQAGQQADYEAAQEKIRVQEGTRYRDQLYGGYMDAANTATDYVSNEITKERSNAALLGIDYDITDDQKSQRINDYFATLWGEGQHSELESYMSEFGNPSGFGGFSVTRGDASKYASADEAEQETIATSKGIKPTLVEDEDTLGAQSNTLGV